ncbi:MAG: hypothetical protein DMF99_28185 [Acidobacteria bacterium]|nr:MAG: hypothetical protein DMF99_28185 [Acidobacteriota bacterium]
MFRTASPRASVAFSSGAAPEYVLTGAEDADAGTALKSICGSAGTAVPSIPRGGRTALPVRASSV